MDTYGHLWPDSDDSTRAAINSVMTAWSGDSADFCGLEVMPSRGLGLHKPHDAVAAQRSCPSIPWLPLAQIHEDSAEGAGEPLVTQAGPRSEVGVVSVEDN